MCEVDKLIGDGAFGNAQHIEKRKMIPEHVQQ